MVALHSGSNYLTCSESNRGRTESIRVPPMYWFCPPAPARRPTPFPNSATSVMLNTVSYHLWFCFFFSECHVPCDSEIRRFV